MAGTNVVRRNLVKIGGLVSVAMLMFYFGVRPMMPPELGMASYTANLKPACAPASRSGAAGFTNGLVSAKGIRYYVRTPQNYKAEYAHPLLMVYASGDSGGRSNEANTGLTKAATEAGFVVAYADSRARAAKSPLEMENILELGTIPAQIAATWCIDTGRIFFTGHSNGGTISNALAILPESPAQPAAIAPSAAGMNDNDLKAYACKKPMPAMIQHSVNDHFFPGYGQQIAKWWAKCNQCSGEAGKADGGCTAYQGCSAPTVFCEGDGPHATWPGRNRQIIDFFSSVSRPRASAE